MELASGGEAATRLADCSAEVAERLKVMARHSLIAARMLARAERNQQLSRGGFAPLLWQETQACEARSLWALPRGNGRPRSRGSSGCCAGARIGVRRIFSAHRGQARCPGLRCDKASGDAAVRDHRCGHQFDRSGQRNQWREHKNAASQRHQKMQFLSCE